MPIILSIDPVRQACYQHMALQMSLFNTACSVFSVTASLLTVYILYNKTRPRVRVYRQHNGGEYAFLGIACDKTRQGDKVVMYESIETGHVYVRDVGEFFSEEPSGAKLFEDIGTRRVHLCRK
jgi:hypothetical protein